MAKTPYFVLLVVLLVMVGDHEVLCRSLRHNSSQLVSDGMGHGLSNHQAPFLLLKKYDDDNGLKSSCSPIYGFLPCTNSISGHVFLILVYEYLLYLGENYIAWASALMFDSLGTGYFGASAFNILSALPVTIFVIASGLSESKEVAQEQVVMGVGLLAGSTIFFLTILWGACVVSGNREFRESSTSKGSEPSTSENSKPSTSKDSKPSTSNESPHKKRLSCLTKRLSCLTGSGITTDPDTGVTAKIMISSLIPFIILQVPNIFKLSFGKRQVVLIALIVSVAFLLSYMLYQIFEPWIQSRRLEYLKHEHLVLGILNHVQRHALGNLLTEDGEPNIRVIKRLFQELDKDGNDRLSHSELEDLILQIKFGDIDLDNDDAVFEVMEELDQDNDSNITKEEFIAAFTKWLDEAKLAISKGNPHMEKSYEHLYQVIQPSIEKRRQKLAKIEQIMAGIIRFAQGHAHEDLLADDGTPNIPSIKSLFAKFDIDGDKRISRAELKMLIVNTKFGNVNWEMDNVIEKVMKELDDDGDEMISEEEFVGVFTKWLKKIAQEIDKKYSKKSLDDYYLKTWEKADKLVDEKKPRGGCVSRPSIWIWLKALSLLFLGTAMLSLLAGPLIESVQNFSDAANIPSFLVSFVIVPLAINSRDAMSMIVSASRKRPRTTSLTFSEIYAVVFMNNILNLFVLLTLVSARGLTWDFSTEVLVVVLVCAIIGLTASFSSTFPLWTCCIAFLLYPLSLALVYILTCVFGWS